MVATKRKLVDTAPTKPASPQKRLRKSTDSNGHALGNTSQRRTPRKNDGTNQSGTPSNLRHQEWSLDDAGEEEEEEEDDEDEVGSPTPKVNGTTLFATPSRAYRGTVAIPSGIKRADQSAKRKSARTLTEQYDHDDWDGEDALAREILDVEGDTVEPTEEEIEDTIEVTTPVETPSKRGRGRPKGAKNKRSPTPEGDLPPEERFFFQNRSGPPQVSSNTLASVKLLTHDEYFQQLRTYKDLHDSAKAFLLKLHARSFPQWKFELEEGFNVCLYGYGSKRSLVNKFAEWLYPRTSPSPRIVIVNGYTPKLNVRSILTTIASTAVDGDELRLVGQPQEMLDSILSQLSSHGLGRKLIILINSIDAPSLRRPAIQAILARLGAHQYVSLLTTADTPSFALMWNSVLRDQFNFAFHDCTTFAPYEAEISVVDEVHELLGRKGRRAGGKEGIGFVLKSLPENARNLYRVLLTEILAVLTDGIGELDEDLPDGEGMGTTKPSREAAEEVGIEYRALYQEASEEFICSSDMNFRFLLKEFHDHQMITSRRDASGTELLGVPLGREEMEGVLEDLVVG